MTKSLFTIIIFLILGFSSKILANESNSELASIIINTMQFTNRSMNTYQNLAEKSISVTGLKPTKSAVECSLNTFIPAQIEYEVDTMANALDYSDLEKGANLAELNAVVNAGIFIVENKRELIDRALSEKAYVETSLWRQAAENEADLDSKQEILNFADWVDQNFKTYLPKYADRSLAMTLMLSRLAIECAENS
ncbi:hypothetical protein DFR28_104282 [Arenicella xantha]|uniref:Uncharacterized protein n=2 Tax=Arenicella xantha TaxID=644221 RepID=A0A395JJX6_9GAMM|nr:hypothetical protein DFR28_104282 [Arenicella xantha]